MAREGLDQVIGRLTTLSLRLVKFAMSPRRGRSLVLIGAPAAGKSTIGRRLADHAGRPLLDLDEEAERFASVGPGEYPAWYRRASPARRAAAFHAVFVQIPRHGAVISTGAQAPCHLARALHLARAGRAVWLEAGPSDLAARLTALHDGANGTLRFRRPVDEGTSLDEHLAARLGRDAPWYAGLADVRVDTAGRSPEDVTDEIVHSRVFEWFLRRGPASRA